MRYQIKAVQNDSVVALVVEADSVGAATSQAQAKGYGVIHVKQLEIWERPSLNWRRERFSALHFSQELFALLSAGLALIEALDALKRKNQGDQTGGEIIDSILATLSEGKPLSVAISNHPQHFSQLYIATLQASERTGNLLQALQRFINYQQQIESVRKKLVSASLYPVLLIGVGALVVMFLLLYVIPRFSKVYESFSGSLPFFSKLLIVTGTWIADHTGIFVIALLTAIIFIAWTALNPHARKLLWAQVNRLPVIAANMQLYEISRLYRTLGMLLMGGVPITRAMQMSSALLREDARAQLVLAHRLISEGRPISMALDEVGLTTPVANRMLIVGERTGEMGVMMERIALFHEEDLTRRIEEASKLFEPILMLAIGLVVGAVVVLMYMPIFELATAIQ